MKLTAVASLLLVAGRPAPIAPAMISVHDGRARQSERGRIKGCGTKGRGPCGGRGAGADDAVPTERVVLVRLRREKKKRNAGGDGAAAASGSKSGKGKAKQAKHIKPRRKGAVGAQERARTPASELCREVAAESGREVVFAYERVFYGCALRLPAAAAAGHAAATASLARHDRVTAVEDDRAVYAQSSSSWGLERVSQCALPLHGAAASPVDADGVRVYVLDTGVYQEHEDFAGVLDPDSDCHNDLTGGSPFDDTDGHGTHVAGTICGANYGVARGCDLCAVKVLTEEGGQLSVVLAGLDHAVEDCVAAFPDETTRQCVINMSLGATGDALNQAVADAVAAGAVVVVAAGNNNGDACELTPASEPRAITVASTMKRDKHSWFSNYGACVDVYGPGSGVTSAGIGSPAASSIRSGTSFAAPHVAGIAAGILREDPTLEPEDVADRIRQSAESLDYPAQEGFKMLLATAVDDCSPPTPAPIPFSCNQEGHASVSVGVTTDNWASETEWQLKNNCDPSQPVVTGTWNMYKVKSQLSSNSYCLPVAEYTFTIRDYYGDGLCCSQGDGGYVVNVDGVEVASGGEFAFSEEATFGSCESGEVSAAGGAGRGGAREEYVQESVPSLQ